MITLTTNIYGFSEKKRAGENARGVMLYQLRYHRYLCKYLINQSPGQRDQNDDLDSSDEDDNRPQRPTKRGSEQSQGSHQWERDGDSSGQESNGRGYSSKRGIKQGLDTTLNTTKRDLANVGPDRLGRSYYSTRREPLEGRNNTENPLGARHKSRMSSCRTRGVSVVTVRKRYAQEHEYFANLSVAPMTSREKWTRILI